MIKNIIFEIIFPGLLTIISGMASLFLDNKAIKLLNNNLYFAVLVRSTLTTLISIAYFIRNQKLDDLNKIGFLSGSYGISLLIVSAITSYITSYFYYLLIKNFNIYFLK